MLDIIKSVLSVYFADFCIVKRDGYSIIAAIAPYTPFAPSEFFLDAYYLHSHSIMRKVPEIKRELMSRGIEVLPDEQVLLKDIATEGGMTYRGVNTLAFTKEHGSRFFIVPFFIAGEYELTGNSQKKCLGCGLCVQKCPTGALTGSGIEREKCLRHIMMHPEAMSEETARTMGNRIFGCDTCQRICPHNKHLPVVINTDIDAVVERMFYSGDVKELQNLIGANFAKFRRMMLMAINAAVNSGNPKYRERLLQLQADPELKRKI